MPRLPSNLPNIPPLKTRRRELRNAPTAAEVVLCKHLQRRQLLGKKFRRQHSIGRDVVDFFCTECNLAIELDGVPHYQILREDYEAERTGCDSRIGRCLRTVKEYWKKSGSNQKTCPTTPLLREGN